jgi:hypothetical protein
MAVKHEDGDNSHKERCAISKPVPASLARSCPRSLLPSRCSGPQDDTPTLLRSCCSDRDPFLPSRCSGRQDDRGREAREEPNPLSPFPSGKGELEFYIFLFPKSLVPLLPEREGEPDCCEDCWNSALLFRNQTDKRAGPGRSTVNSRFIAICASIANGTVATR